MNKETDYGDKLYIVPFLSIFKTIETTKQSGNPLS